MLVVGVSVRSLDVMGCSRGAKAVAVACRSIQIPSEWGSSWQPLSTRPWISVVLFARKLQV